MIYGVIPAGGIGSRMGNKKLPKQYMEIEGKPILLYTIEKLLTYSEFFKILVLCPSNFVAYTKKMLKEYQISDKVIVLEGGETRNETIMKSISYIETEFGLKEEDILLTHDSVRPFVTQRIIRENVEAAMKYGAANTVIEAVDTIVESADGIEIKNIPDRKYMYQTQTPQTFGAKKLRDLFQSLKEEEREILTDAAKIYVLRGEKVFLVRGEPFNLKITFPYDLAVAKELISLGYMEKE